MEIGSSSEHLLRTSNLTNGDVKEIITYEMSRTPHFLKSAKLLQTARDKDGEYWHGDNCTIKSNAVNHGRYSNFGDCGESVIWIPKNREDWIKSIDEMTNLCREAALRSSVLLDTKRFDDPLSKAYIKDRIDIDDPLRGFQICHKFGGWMQGFVLTTTFTTWTLYFKWDSKHPQSGMVGNTKARPNAPGRAGWDSNGVMARELEKQHRSGDPHGGGVVWHNVAELSLIGGLGCGEYLLRMALDDISRRGVYDYVVESTCFEWLWMIFLAVGFMTMLCYKQLRPVSRFMRNLVLFALVLLPSIPTLVLSDIGTGLMQMSLILIIMVVHRI